MKYTKNFILLMVMQLALLHSFRTLAQTNGDFQSVTSGNWNSTSTWETYSSGTWVAATVIPSGPRSVTIRNGHTITLNVNGNCNKLTVDNGGVFTTASATVLTVRGNILNNGKMSSTGTDGMIITIHNSVAAMTISGSGTDTIGRIRAIANNPNNLKITIDKNIYLLASGTTALSLYYNDGTNTPVATDSLTFTINSGKTVKFVNNGAFHASSSSTPYAAGKYVYNINGTLDMSSSTATSYVVPDSVTALSRTYVNVSGILKLSKALNGVNPAPSGHDGKVIFTINAGGVVDATATTSLAIGTNYFITNGTGALRRVVGSSNVTFPVGTSTGMGTVVLNNSKTVNNFSVGVNNTFDSPVPDTAKVVKHQWSILPDGHGALVTINLSWLTTQQASGFSPTGKLSMINLDTTWKENFAGVTGAGTVSSPYVASNNWAYAKFGKFAIENGNLPVDTGRTATQIMTDFAARNPANEHPRLFVHSSNFSAFTAKIDSISTLRAIKSRIVDIADSLKTVAILTSTSYSLETARTALARIWPLSQAYRFTGDTTYALRAWQEMNAVAGFSTWKDPTSSATFDLAMSEMLTAVAFGYDWCYDYLSSTRRSTIRTAMINKALSFGLTCYRNPGAAGSGWLTATGDNWSFVCNSGLAIGALALADNYSNAGEILSSGLKYLQFPLNSVVTDGAWPEGITYWRYGMDYFAKHISCLRSALGTEYGYCDGKPGVHKSAYFPIDQFGTTTFNFKDAGVVTDNSRLLFMFFADRFQDPVLANYRYAQIKNFAASKGTFEDMLWWKTSLIDTIATYTSPESYLNTTPRDKDNRYNSIEAITFRKDWRTESTFAGFKNGQINGSHTHLDAGSFVYDAMGVRWANDQGPDDYGIPNYRFDAYKTRAEGHNTLVINPDANSDQDIAATAPIINYSTGTDVSFAIADLTQVYGYKGATNAQRGIALRSDKRTLLVQDELTFSAPSEVYWFMHTPYKALLTIAGDGRSVKVTKSGKSIEVILLKPAGAVFTKINARPLPTSPNPPTQNTNPDREKVTLHLTGFTSDTIAVYIAPLDSITPTLGSIDTPKIIPLSEWGTSEALRTPALQKSSLLLNSNDGKVDLLWNAVNSAKSSFIVQRSNGTGFKTIGQAQGNTMGKITFTDEKPVVNTRSYYRIMQVSNRKIMYSDTGSVDLKIKPEDDFMLYPNPASSTVALRLKTTNKNLKLVVVSFYGKSVLNVSGSLEEINRQLNLKMPAMQPGTYVVNITDADRKYTRQLIKQ